MVVYAIVRPDYDQARAAAAGTKVRTGFTA
jgi:hypothetical protein